MNDKKQREKDREKQKSRMEEEEAPKELNFMSEQWGLLKKSNNLVKGLKIDLLENRQPLTNPQEQLLKKLISFQSIELDGEHDQIKKDLYNIFFNWRQTKTQQIASAPSS